MGMGLRGEKIWGGDYRALKYVSKVLDIMALHLFLFMLLFKAEHQQELILSKIYVCHFWGTVPTL